MMMHVVPESAEVSSCGFRNIAIASCCTIVYSGARVTDVPYHYTNLTVVRESVRDREVNGSHSNRAKKFSFSASLDLDVTTGSPTDIPATAPAAE